MGGIYPQIDWLQGLASTTMEDQLFRGQPHGAGLWCLPSLALECVTYIGGWVVFQHGLNKVGLLSATRPDLMSSGQETHFFESYFFFTL